MKIDCDYVIEKADDLTKIVLNMREIPVLYVIKLANGTEYTVKFDEESLARFCPNETVSHMMTAWEESIKNTHSLYCEAVKTKIHPYWTSRKKNLETGKDEIVGQKMTQYQIDVLKIQISSLEEKMGKMYFVKIC